MAHRRFLAYKLDALYSNEHNDGAVILWIERRGAFSGGSPIPVFCWVCGTVPVQPEVICWREDEVEARSTSGRL